jgi:hypothetical protein
MKCADGAVDGVGVGEGDVMDTRVSIKSFHP